MFLSHTEFLHRFNHHDGLVGAYGKAKDIMIDEQTRSYQFWFVTTIEGCHLTVTVNTTGHIIDCQREHSPSYIELMAY